MPEFWNKKVSLESTTPNVTSRRKTYISVFPLNGFKRWEGVGKEVLGICWVPDTSVGKSVGSVGKPGGTKIFTVITEHKT